MSIEREGNKMIYNILTTLKTIITGAALAAAVVILFKLMPVIEYVIWG